MGILKKENWWAWLMMFLFAGNAGTIVLAALLDCFDKDAWYAKPKNWIIAAVCFIFPIFIMLAVFIIQMLCQVSAKLKVPGSELYLSPFVWLLCLIVPIIGWIFLYVMLFYLNIWNIVMLYRGAGEEFVK